MSASILNLSGFRRLPTIRQTETAECGLACIAMIAAYHGHDTDLATLRRRFRISIKGATLRTMMDIATAMGLGSRAVRCELEEWRELRKPAILHWDLNHFVVLKSVGANTAVIHDPATGPQRITYKEASKRFSGVALELTPNDGFRRKRERNVLKLGTLIKFSAESLRSFAQALVLTLVVELLVIATPFYMQTMIDNVIQNGDANLAIVLASCFGVVLLFRVVAGALRELTVQFLGSVLSFEAEARLFHHLLRLPLDWFHRRQTGDVQSRFGSVETVKEFVSGTAIVALFDGIFGALVAVIMCVYSMTLGLVVLISVAVYTLLRLFTLQIQRRVAGDYIIAEAREQTSFLETLRAAQTIKAANEEVQRESLQRNAIASTLNARIRGGNINIAYRACEQFVVGGASVLVVYFGVMAVLDSEITVGMLTAFMAYKAQFERRAEQLVQSLVSWRLLDVHLERVADIALHPKEAARETTYVNGDLQGRLDVRGVTYSYGPGEPTVLQHVSFSVSPGEHVAITGTSGCGKSTLLRILCGLYEADQGEVLLDGRPLSVWGIQTVRRATSVVLQDDNLLQGSISENIAFFDEGIDMDRVVAAARSAAIHGDIENMPMGYDSLVGDMGSSLSGGQKQRVMIARGIYRNPKILLMDEGTSQIDVETERKVNEALAALGMTRVVVAHRKETLEAADRVIDLGVTQASRFSETLKRLSQKAEGFA